ncbi:hypothetical protein QA648_22540 (plasmid) [Rhizobium sp. CB3171]|uniref:hypothetical protein n=1 Tax=Rhizobium sp. CB3171 TaxID=3039157 RepID=UPI0024B20CA1|nr:hypothetical protein [Rhizobium sp. CB3171]WFU06550.1 hypothetical protein QA648_22540 [Rhizobium sp. CB3171]
MAGDVSDGCVIVEQRPNIAIAAFVGIVAVLVAAFEFPPLLDYPNHYARMWLLAGGITEQPFQQIYAIDWSRTFTNAGIDLLAYYLGPLIGVSFLARILLFLAIVSPPLGAIALHRRLFQGAFYWQVAILYFAWCATLIGGFINFQIGLGMALFFATVDHALQPGSQTALLLWRIAAGLLLTIMHIFSLGFYIALLCGLELSSTLEPLAPRNIVRLCVRLAIGILACVLPAVCLFIYAPVLPNSGDAGFGAIWNNSPTLILANLMSAMWTYVSMVDALFLIPLVLICTNALRTRRLRLHCGLGVTVVGLVILSCVSPLHIMGTGWISWRFPIMAALGAMAMICPLPQLPRREALMLVAVLSCVVFGRTVWVGFNWWCGQADVANIRAVLAAIPKGSAILPVAHEPRDIPTGTAHRHFAWNENTFRHLPTLAVPFAHSFVPTLFTAKGKQPLAVLPPWTNIAVPEGNLLSVSVLDCPDLVESFSAFTPYLIDWRRRFDFVLVVNADLPDRYSGDRVPAGLKVVSDTPFAKLYAIDKRFISSSRATPQKNARQNEAIQYRKRPERDRCHRS